MLVSVAYASASAGERAYSCAVQPAGRAATGPARPAKPSSWPDGSAAMPDS